MSSNGEEVGSAAQLDIQQQAEKIRRERLEAVGLADQFDLWRESMPNSQMDDNEVYNLFVESQLGEEAANTGTLSVSTGGTEITADTEVPVPEVEDEGEDGEKPKKATDTGETRETDLTLVEGMWQPPEDATAENYEPPSTAQMSQSKEWIENARIFHEAMGSPLNKYPEPDPLLGLRSVAEMMGKPAPVASDAEIGEWARNQMSGFNWNVMNTVAIGHTIMSSNDTDLAVAALNLINMYDHSSGSGMDFAGAVQEVMTDPTTYLGLGVGSVVAKGAAKATAKAGLTKAMQMAIVGGTAGSVEGGMIAGGFDLTKQNIEQEAGARKDIDYGRAGTATGMGVGLGALLGGATGGWLGKKADQFKKLMDEDKALIAARDVFLDESAMKEMGQEDLQKILNDMMPHDPKGKDKNISAMMAARILDEDGQMPRLEDGSVNYAQIIKAMNEVKAEQVVVQAAQAAKTIKSEEELYNFMDKVSEKDNNWVMEDGTGDITYFNEDGNYIKLARIAEHMEIDYNIGGRGGVEVFSLDGGTPTEKGAFMQVVTDTVPQPPPKVGQTVAKTESDVFEYMDMVSEADNNWLMEDGSGNITYFDEAGDYSRLEKVATKMGIDHNVGGRGGVEVFSLDGGTPDEILAFMHKVTGIKPSTPSAARAFKPDIADADSQKLAQKIMEMDELERGDVVMRSTNRPGSRVKDALGESYEVVGHTKNGWYRLRDHLGREKSLRRKDFEVTEKAPPPKKAGPMELDPFSDTAAKIISMSEEALSGDLKLRPVTTTHKEIKALAQGLDDIGIDITRKPINDYWTPAELLFLRDTYDRQGHAMADLARKMESLLRNEGRLTDSQLAEFNNAHSVFVATRDLFYGTSGNAARQLNILRSKPVSGVYDFSQSLLDSISLQGGRANTERAITQMAQFARKGEDGGNFNTVKGISELSQNIWGNPKAAMLLNLRYNVMLSSWRTHFYNFLGNSASGAYQTLAVSPVRMGINNINHAGMVALGKLDKRFTPDPADRMTWHNYYAEIRGHFAGAMDSLILAREIALGRDIGEGKVWNELGLRYNVVNVPQGVGGKIGTTPVRALEAGDAFFKNQYYNSKMQELASIKARYDEIHNGKDFQTRFHHYINHPDEMGGAAERTAREYAAKQTYTNDPNVYGGVLAAVAKGVSSAQNQSLAVNMIVPFVRTPANLLMYAMETIGVQQALTPAKTWRAISQGTQRESQEALAKLTVAAGFWLVIQEMHSNGQITGTGPGNWEERKVWMAAGWQPNSIKVRGKWYSMERAAPVGQSMATIASVFDYYSMVEQQEQPAMEWVGAGLLYTADMIMDESYLSSAVDILTAISSKEESRFQAAGASMLNSFVVPNIMRDLRRPDDEMMREVTGTNLLDAMHKQMMNATPGYLDIGLGSSTDLPPKIDWKGDVMNYYGDAYVRAIVPFNIRDPEDNDPASMALAYARIPVSKPNKSIAWPGGLGDSINLMAMDGGQGFVYNEYQKRMGKMRERVVNELLTSDYWDRMVRERNIGPGSEGDRSLRGALATGSRLGRLEMLGFLIEHSGSNNTYYKTGPDGFQMKYLIQHPVSVEEYIALQEAVRSEKIAVPDDQKQYVIKKPVDGPEFFKP